MTTPAPFEIRTERLLIRAWRDDDVAACAAMNADPRVMEFFPSVMSPEQSAAAHARNRERIARLGHGFWPVEVIGGAPFIGMCGLLLQDFKAHFTPAVEIGWRLAAEHWGRGYATEAARAVLAYGFGQLAMQEVVSMTTVGNLRSRRVMEKLGMTRTPADDFLHPSIPDGHPQQPHVLYRLRRP